MQQTREASQDVASLVTDAVVAQYWERGYWISPPLFDAAQVARLRAAHERLWCDDLDHEILSQYGKRKVDPASPQVRQQCNAFWVNDEIRAAVTNPLLGAIGARLMKVETVRLWHDQAIYKPGIGPEGEAPNTNQIGWHQDYAFWQASSTTNMCTAWVALQDTDLTNGGMRTIVGSHSWGLIEGSNTFFNQDLEELARRYAREGKGSWLDEPCIMQAGQVSFHHSLTFHGSGPNRTNQPRLSVVAHMMPGDTVYRAGRQWHPNLVFLGPNARDGQPFAGDYWPQLWPAS
jgi:ectoine hydroxylase-related dioxygenase (phytanoyl-CoA dioxygenase family)